MNSENGSRKQPFLPPSLDGWLHVTPHFQWKEEREKRLSLSLSLSLSLCVWIYGKWKERKERNPEFYSSSSPAEGGQELLRRRKRRRRRRRRKRRRERTRRRRRREKLINGAELLPKIKRERERELELERRHQSGFFFFYKRRGSCRCMIFFFSCDSFLPKLPLVLLGGRRGRGLLFQLCHCWLCFFHHLPHREAQR